MKYAYYTMKMNELFEILHAKIKRFDDFFFTTMELTILSLFKTQNLITFAKILVKNTRNKKYGRPRVTFARQTTTDWETKFYF